MEEYCQNPLCENEAVKEVLVSVEKPSDQTRSLCAACEEVYVWGVQHGTKHEGMKIDPPPEEIGDEPLFRVVYMIDVNAADVREAAEYTHRIMTDPDSLRPVLHVIDSNGKVREVDLSEDDGDCEDSVKTPNYDAAARYLADQGKLVFTGSMNGGLWNARCMDASIMSKEQGYKAAYELLLKFGDQCASDLSVDQQRQWWTIKDRAAVRLKGNPENTGQVQRQPGTFTKTTVGFVAQTFEKNDEGRFVCTHQEFIAGDRCDYEDAKGNPIEPPDYEYQPYNMTLRITEQSEAADNEKLSKAHDAIEEVLESLDVGGEQSRQFAQEIRILRDIIGQQ